MAIAIVTGASSGMGREFVRQLDQNADIGEIWAVARREDRLLKLKDQCKTPVRAFPCNLVSDSDIKKLGAAIDSTKGKISMLINCAGFAKFGGFDDIAENDAMGMIDLNIRALVRMVEMCVPNMMPGGRIINIASTAAFQPLPDMNIYAASKAFVLSYSRALSRELGDKDISVTTVCPGWTKTEFTKVAGEGTGGSSVKNFMFMMKPETVVKSALKAAQKRREICVPGIINKGHLFFSKILPAGSIMLFWNAMK